MIQQANGRLDQLQTTRRTSDTRFLLRDILLTTFISCKIILLNLRPPPARLLTPGNTKASSFFTHRKVIMEKLIRGIHTFQREVFGTQQQLFSRLAGGQHPDALFVTCSDSRIDPCLVTQSEPGDLFVLRNAGNIIPPYGASNGGGAAAVEFAVSGLGVKDIIVCGHSQCGAVSGLLHLEKLKEMPTVAAWLQHASTTKRIVDDKYADVSDDDLMTAAIKENVLVQLDNLRTHPSVASKLSRGELNLHAWVYTFENGRMFNYDPDARQFAAFNAE